MDVNVYNVITINHGGFVCCSKFGSPSIKRIVNLIEPNSSKWSTHRFLSWTTMTPSDLARKETFQCSSNWPIPLIAFENWTDLVIQNINWIWGRHKYVVLFHLLFRISALVVYMFCTWFSDGFITSFVLTIILLALDFWTVKNITGMVGLLPYYNGALITTQTHKLNR